MVSTPRWRKTGAAESTPAEASRSMKWRALRLRPTGACCDGSTTDTGAVPVDKGCGGQGCRQLAASADSESRQKLCCWREGWLGGRLALDRDLQAYDVTIDEILAK